MAKRISKLVFVFSVIITLSSIIAVVAILNRFKISLVRVADISVPSYVQNDGFGLFCYDDTGEKIDTLTKNAPFDANKPTVVFFSGIRKDKAEGFDEERSFQPTAWKASGYNVMIFLWDKLASDEVYMAERKIWSGAHGQKENDGINYSVAEAFAAYYFEFLEGCGASLAEIRFQGVSLGAQLAVAAASYLAELERSDLIDARLLPGRITLFDASFSSDAHTGIKVSWTDKAIGGSTARLSYRTVLSLKKRGIATEYINSSAEISTDDTVGKSYFERLCLASCYMDVAEVFSTEADAFGKGCTLYNSQVGKGTPFDGNQNVGLRQAVPSPDAPTVDIYTKMGITYIAKLKDGGIVYTSSGIASPVIAGVCYVDEGSNAAYNGGMELRLAGVTVELYLVSGGSGRLIGRTVTSDGGIYILPIEPIYVLATNAMFYIRAVGETKVTQYSSGAGIPMGAGLYSSVLKISARGETAAINAGFTPQK